MHPPRAKPLALVHQSALTLCGPWQALTSMAAEGRQQELERANLEEIVTKIEADTVPAADSCGPRLKSPIHRCGPSAKTLPMPSLANPEVARAGYKTPHTRRHTSPVCGRLPGPHSQAAWEDEPRVRNSRDDSFKPTGAAS